MDRSCLKIEASNMTSTPKRRRLGTRRIIPRVSRENGAEEKNHLTNRSDSSRSECLRVDELSPLGLPNNQVEYLNRSMRQSSDMLTTFTSELSQCSITRDIECENWDSPIFTSQKNMSHLSPFMNVTTEHHDSENITDDMFNSVLAPPQTYIGSKSNVFDTSNTLYRQDIEQMFEDANRTICDINLTNEEKDTNVLFESSDCLETKKINVDSPFQTKNNISCREHFYGLPLVAKALFKMYRNIDKFYDWQEECLNLSAIKKHKNLIYALPTSGGKTLVAEVLMMREVLNCHRNALFILPFVAIVQEKIWGLSPFAVQLGFLVEEYAAGKGLLPPKKRRKKNSIYVATIEKGLALVRNLIELKRIDELGLIVVDELHLIGEKNRGATLETLLATVIFANNKIQIVGMSATIGNLHEIAQFMNAEVYEQTFRPIELVEYVKLGNSLHKLESTAEGIEVTPCRELCYEYTEAANGLDPDRLGGLVSEVVPHSSCLIFCPTKNNCENVASLLCKLQRKEMLKHQSSTRAALSAALRAEGSSDLARTVRFGIAYHHAGLAADERRLLEDAFRSGVISVLCCTSTLAAGVNLPARRVIVRSPLVGREFITLGAYRQMAGRAGRAGVCQEGESIIICSPREWPRFLAALEAGLAPARSTLAESTALRSAMLSAVALGLANSRSDLHRFAACTLLYTQANSLNICIKTLCDEALKSLIKCGAMDITPSPQIIEKGNCSEQVDCFVYSDSVFSVSQLGNAAIKGGMEVDTVRQVCEDARCAARGLVVLGALHLLYLVAPIDSALPLDARAFYNLYSKLDEEGFRTAKALGITEATAVQMMTGKQITTVSERILKKFYMSLVLRDLWNQTSVADVAEKYGVPRGMVQTLMTSAAAQAAAILRLTEVLPELWPFRALLAELAPRLQHCAAPHLQQLMDLPGVKKARAMQLVRAGYRSVEQLARASPVELADTVQYLSRTSAYQLVSAAKMALIEKVENLRAEAEEVMSQLNL